MRHVVNVTYIVCKSNDEVYLINMIMLNAKSTKRHNEI